MNSHDLGGDFIIIENANEVYIILLLVSKAYKRQDGQPHNLQKAILSLQSEGTSVTHLESKKVVLDVAARL
jgi:hypothetical protein